MIGPAEARRPDDPEWAYERAGTPVDARTFYELACDPARHVAVEACAGAGKTWILVSRILRALLAGTPAHEILAITFTKKAAGEMRERLAQWLADFARAEPAQLLNELQMRGLDAQQAAAQSETARGLLRRVLEAGRPVQIRTFHSWFAALLSVAPLALREQLQLPAHYELLEDDSQAIEQVWRRFHADLLGHAEAEQDYRWLVQRHGRHQARKALESALARRSEFALSDALGVVDRSVLPFGAVFADFADAELPEAALFGQGRSLLADAARALGRATAPTFAACGGALEQALSAGDAAAAGEALFTKQGEPRKFNDRLAGIETVRRAQELVQRVQAAGVQHQAWLYQQVMARLTRRLVAQFTALKRERGWVDMNDVERAATRLLSDPVASGWVHQRLDARVRHLLVDEFQDTNPLQWQALHSWLGGYAGAGGGAVPSIFIVGDPKQSIYRFRRAEPQVFRAAQAFVRDGLGGELLSCDHTRRNAAAVLAVVNGVMGAAQAAGEYEGFRPHTTASTDTGSVRALPLIGRDDAPPAAAAPAAAAAEPWRDSLTTPRELAEDSLRQRECRQAAQWLALQLQGGVLRPRDVMVLARRRDRLRVMEDELRRLAIAAQQPERRELAEAPEVQDVLALVDALVSPGSDLALARALKSPLFGVGDEDLAALVALREVADMRAGARHQSWFEQLHNTPALPARLLAVAPVLRRWQAWLAALPPHDALDAIYHDGDVLARYAQAVPAALCEGMLANLRALLGSALQVDGGRYATPYGWVRALRRGGVQAPLLAQADAVRLLTIHGAKGLEAPLVLLLDTDAPAARAETMGVLIEWPGAERAPLRFVFLASEVRAPACCIGLLAAEQAARRREELNALYVALTRCRCRLAVSAVQPHHAAAGSWWRRLHAHGTGLQAEPAAPAAPHTTGYVAHDAGDDALPGNALRSVVTLLELPAAPAGAPSAARPAETPLALVGQAMHRLLEWSASRPLDDQQVAGDVAREFRLDDAQLAQALAMARRIRSGDAGWAWDAAVVDWQADELAVVHEGKWLRLDRLVRRRDTGHWWVLDHKSAHEPQRRPELLAQLSTYRAAVQAREPQAVVRAAFLSADGRLVEIEAGSAPFDESMGHRETDGPSRDA